MKKKKYLPAHPIVDKVRKIMVDRGMTQVAAAECMGTSPSQFSKMLTGEVQTSLWQISNFATSVGMELIDVLTYPEKFVKADIHTGNNEVEAVLQIKLSSDKKEQVLKMVFGDSNLEILKQ